MRRATWGLVAAGLSALATGCMKDNSVAQTSYPPPRPDQITKEEPGPVRQPKTETCVAAGVWFESSGDSSKMPEKKHVCYDKARIAYEQALDIDKKNKSALLALARLAEKENNPVLAVGLYEKAVRTLSADASVWYEHGMCCARQKNWENAIASLGRATELEPNNSHYLNTLGWTLARAERFDDAIRVFRQTVGEAAAYVKVAAMAEHLGRKDLVLQYAQAALQLDSQLKEAGELLARLNNPPKADPAVQQAGAVVAPTQQ